jgi:hypothetical protein
MPGPGSRASPAGPTAAGKATGSAGDERASLGSGPGRPRGRRATRSRAPIGGSSGVGVPAVPAAHPRRRRGASCTAFAARTGLSGPSPSRRGCRGALCGGSDGPDRRARPGAVGARGSSGLASGSGGGTVGAPFALPAGRVRPVPGTTIELLRETDASGQPRPAARCGRGHFPAGGGTRPSASGPGSDDRSAAPRPDLGGRR